MSTAPADPIHFREAIEWFGTKVPMTRDTWDQIATNARKRAFAVAHVATAELVRGIHDSLSRAIAQGQSFDEWQQAAAPEIAAAWGAKGTSAWHLETIFRTNVQSAYGAGRYAQLTDPAMLKLRPYWMFDSIKDSRTTDECRELNGTVMPANDPWWDGRIPPLHYNCRSSIRSLRQSEAEKQAKFSAPPPTHEGAEGFGGTPLVKESELQVDLTKYPGAVAPTLSVQLSQDPSVLPMPLREPPVGMVGPAHGPTARRGGQWEHGYVRTDRIRPDGSPAGGFKPAEPAPYFSDEELRPSGHLSKHPNLKHRDQHERAVDDYLVTHGHNVVQLPHVATAHGVKMPDAEVNGVRVEYRTVSGTGNSLMLAFHAKARGQQARHIIFDLRSSTLTLDEALRAINTDQKRPPPTTAKSSQKAFSSIRLIGANFDATIEV